MAWDETFFRNSFSTALNSKIDLQGAQGNAYRADAAFTNARAAEVPADSASSRALQEAQRSLYSAQAVEVPADSASNRTYQDRTGRAAIQNADSGALSADADHTNANTLMLKALGKKRGVAKVPGKGSGDKVPAMLEPGEAVLNKHAAGMIGHDLIAKANKKGNQMRDKEDAKTAKSASKLADALKMMGMV
jgi:hypothetical protein